MTGPDPALSGSRSLGTGPAVQQERGYSCPVPCATRILREESCSVSAPSSGGKIDSWGGRGGVQGSDLATCVVSASPTAKNASPQGHQHLREGTETKEKGLRRNRDNKARRRRKAKITPSEIPESVLHPKPGRGYRERMFTE